jgi:cation diffusion facilitator family transporter
MHQADPAPWRHSHNYAIDSSLAERRTRIVIGITATMMVVEITGGIMFHSMAVLADGWHMGTHVSAFLIAAIAYRFTRRHADDPRFSFGTGKIGVLGGFASAVVLSVVAFLMAGESIHHLLVPQPIEFSAAIGIACVALAVNLVSALLLNVGHGHHSHDHGHDHHGHDHHHGHGEDLNLRAAYLHVLADAMTTVAAIVALLAGKFFGWSWLDPVVGLAGSVVVFSWAYSLLRATSGILLDRTPESSDLPEEIRRAVESDGDSVISDLHIWQVSAGKYAAIVSIVAHEPKPADAYRELFHEHEELVHVTVEVQRCQEEIESGNQEIRKTW